MHEDCEKLQRLQGATRVQGQMKEEPSYLVVTPLANDRLLVRIDDASADGKLVTYQKCP
jgi:hypothetical protein